MKTLDPKDLAALNSAVRKRQLVQALGQSIFSDHDSLLDDIRKRYGLSGPITYDSNTGEIKEPSNG